jgi:hypothetical protein
MAKRLAQFGGTGGQNSPYAPGGSPIFRGGPSGYSGYGVNDFSRDLGLDLIISRSHKPGMFGSEKPFETLLEMFHDDVEKNAEPYLLTFEEREKLSLKKKIRNKEQYIHDLAYKNDKESTNEIPKKLKTIEELLTYRRKDENKDFSKYASAYEDITEGSLDSKLNKFHINGDSYYRKENSPKMNMDQLPTISEYDAEGNDLNLTKNRLTQPFTGNEFHYEDSDGADKYWNGEISGRKDGNDLSIYPTQTSGFEPELLMNYPDTSENVTHQAPNYFKDLSSEITPKSKQNNQTLEKKLEELKKKINPKKLETSLGKIDWDEWAKGTAYERNVTDQTGYGADGFGTVSNPALVGPGPAGAGVYPIAGYL